MRKIDAGLLEFNDSLVRHVDVFLLVIVDHNFAMEESIGLPFGPVTVGILNSSSVEVAQNNRTSGLTAVGKSAPASKFEAASVEILT